MNRGAWVVLFGVCAGCNEAGNPAAGPVSAHSKALPPAAPVAASLPAAVPVEDVPAAEPPAADLPAVAESPPAEPIKPRKILGQFTQDVRDAEKEEAAGAKRLERKKITGQDPITVSGNAYVTIIGRIEQLQIEDAVRKFHAINERYPKDLNEFMREIIKGYGIRLPQLPFYQEYGYDVPNHKLVILEYPDRKAQLPGGGN